MIPAGRYLLIAVWPLALYSIIASAAQAQPGCVDDGAEFKFFHQQGGTIALNAVRVREITGNPTDDRAIAHGGSLQPLSGRVSGSAFVVDSQGSENFRSNLLQADFSRSTSRFWEAKYKRGVYTFRRKSDLKVDVLISPEQAQANHVDSGKASTAMLETTHEGLSIKWYSGKDNSLKSVKGAAQHTYSNLEGLNQSGEHQATIEVCVNIEGYI